MISYLSSDMFPGIGPKIAKTIVEKLGLNCLTLIKENEDALKEINLTDKQKAIIKTGIISDEINQETIVFFLDNGISMDMGSQNHCCFWRYGKRNCTRKSLCIDGKN